MTWNVHRFVLGIILLVGSGVAPSVSSAQIPSRAYQYRRVLHAETRRQWGLNLPVDAIAVGAGTIHQESMWNPRAQSIYAQGLTQFTPVTFAEMRRIDPSIYALGDIWNPTAAIRAMAHYHRLLWDQFPLASTVPSRWAFVLSSYNGGAGNVRKDMKLAADPTSWWNAVELKSTRSSAAFKENRQYVRNILTRWVSLYRNF